MNSSGVTPDQPQWWKNSFLRRLKKPSHAALSRLHPLADTLLTRPAPLTDGYPLGPAVVAAVVRAYDGAEPLVPPPQGLERRRVRQCLVRVPPDRPGDGHPVEAVDDGAQVDLLARREPELGDIGEPQLVERQGVEVPAHEVWRGGGDLALVGAVAPAAVPGAGGAQPLLTHDAPDALLAGGDAPS